MKTKSLTANETDFEFTLVVGRIHFGTPSSHTTRSPSAPWGHLQFLATGPLCRLGLTPWKLASSKPARKTHRHKHTQRNFSKISTTLCSRMHKAYHLSLKLLIINTASVPPTHKWRKLHKSMDMKKVGITKVILKSVHHGAQLKLFWEFYFIAL